MRLLPNEIHHIQKYFQNILEASGSHLYLFGSRLKQNAKGGDIDLLVVTPTDEMASIFYNRKHFWVYDLQGLIGEQKIDITVASQSQISKDEFLRQISSEAKEI